MKKVNDEGSPPRMRGKGDGHEINFEAAGITPAHAGKSLTGLQSLSANKDHPRACGEKMSKPMSSKSNWGSPPRMRGKEPAAPSLT